MQPGFRDYPDRFCIIPCRTPDAPEETALDTVYEVTAEKEINDFMLYIESGDEQYKPRRKEKTETEA